MPLVLIELKSGGFELQDKGQVQWYLCWLEKYERREPQIIFIRKDKFPLFSEENLTIYNIRSAKRRKGYVRKGDFIWAL